MPIRLALAFALLALTLPARAAEDVAVPFPRVGRLATRPAKAIAASSWSIGGETLDRDYADYAKYRTYLGPLGAKAIRVQAGWAKCERRAGAYEWAWLDAVVDDALAQGVRPWLEASYGNTLYPGGGGTGLGGGVPTSPEALAAWDKWVAALVDRYKDRVTEWEVWNEPDLGKDLPPERYAAFFIRTATTIRAGQKDAKVYALGLASNAKYLETFLEEIKRADQLALMDAVTVHSYPKNPDDTYLADRARTLLARYAPHAHVRQGETGAPSTAGTFGALAGHPWTELTQAKYDLRRMLAHHAKDVPFNLFTLMELNYTTAQGKRLNTKGLLQSNPDGTVARPKPAYHAAGRVFSTFDDTLVRVADYPHTAKAPTTQKVVVTGYARKGTSAQVVTCWLGGAIPTDSNASTLADLTFPRGQFVAPVYVDLLSGAVYEIPKANWERQGEGVTFRQVPLYDSPILIADRAAIGIVADGAAP